MLQRRIAPLVVSVPCLFSLIARICVCACVRVCARALICVLVLCVLALFSTSCTKYYRFIAVISLGKFSGFLIFTFFSGLQIYSYLTSVTVDTAFLNSVYIPNDLHCVTVLSLVQMCNMKFRLN
jgi:hypothetical protein